MPVIILVETEKTVNLFGYTNIFSMHNVFLLLGFFCLGYILKDIIEFIASRKENPRKNYFLYIALAVFVLSIIVCALVNKGPSRPAGYYGMSVLNLKYNSIYIYIPITIAILTFLTLVLALLPSNQAVRMLSQSSFFIMATHYLFFRSPFYSSPSYKANKWKLAMHTGIKESLYIIAITIAVLYVLYLFRKNILNSQKYLLILEYNKKHGIFRAF